MWYKNSIEVIRLNPEKISVGLITIILLIGSQYYGLFMHEFSHMFVAILCGYRVDGIGYLTQKGIPMVYADIFFTNTLPVPFTLTLLAGVIGSVLLSIPFLISGLFRKNYYLLAFGFWSILREIWYLGISGILNIGDISVLYERFIDLKTLFIFGVIFYLIFVFGIILSIFIFIRKLRRYSHAK
ncbi:MAG: hypothetical protein KJI71_01700 [Patescibacteria group bacterium]|nr:hypothetical protein [Patescibacteria group bacterium]